MSGMPPAIVINSGIHRPPRSRAFGTGPVADKTRTAAPQPRFVEDETRAQEPPNGDSWRARGAEEPTSHDSSAACRKA
jgi:hypothetical protein